MNLARLGRDDESEVLAYLDLENFEKLGRVDAMKGRDDSLLGRDESSEPLKGGVIVS